jgi:carbon-monoxide dehydrogenase large subunit
MDYLAPTAAELCPIEIVHLETPSAFSETGAKGMGEGGTIGAPAAVLNAINDALSGTAVSFDQIPVLPTDVHAALTNTALTNTALTNTGLANTGLAGTRTDAP